MSRIILVTLLIAVIVVGVFANSIGTFDPKPALKLVVMTDLDENETVKVTNVTFEQTTVSFFYKQTDDPTKFPDISAFAKYNVINSPPITYWSSEYRKNDKDTYSFILTFRSGKEPKVNDTLIIPIRITNFRGKQEYKTTAFYEWK